MNKLFAISSIVALCSASAMSAHAEDAKMLSGIGYGISVSKFKLDTHVRNNEGAVTTAKWKESKLTVYGPRGFVKFISAPSDSGMYFTATVNAMWSPKSSVELSGGEIATTSHYAASKAAWSVGGALGGGSVITSTPTTQVKVGATLGYKMFDSTVVQKAIANSSTSTTSTEVADNALLATFKVKKIPLFVTATYSRLFPSETYDVNLDITGTVGGIYNMTTLNDENYTAGTTKTKGTSVKYDLKSGSLYGNVAVNVNVQFQSFFIGGQLSGSYAYGLYTPEGALSGESLVTDKQKKAKLASRSFYDFAGYVTIGTVFGSDVY